MTLPDEPAPESNARKPAQYGWIALTLVLVYLAAAVPLILFAGALGVRGDDQINYHEPTVHTFAEQLPRPDLSNYLSATTPGYHLVLAVVERVVSGDARVLQLAAGVFTILLLVLLARTVRRVSDVSRLEALVLCLPVLSSMYVFSAGVWLLPDNAGWLAVLACLALALREPFDRRTVVLGGLALVGLVLVRQVHLWAAGVLWAAAWLAPGISASGKIRELTSRVPGRMKSLTPMLIASVPALLVLGWFMSMWKGLVPPTFQKQYGEMSPASFAFILSLLGIGSVFFVGYLADALADAMMKKSKRAGVAIAALAGAVIAVIPETTYVVPGRFGGLWGLVNKAPIIAGHTSPVIVAFSAFGAAMLVIWCRAIPAKQRWIFLGAWFGFAVAQTFSAQLWQRYSEPFVLIMLALMAAASRPTGSMPGFTRKLTEPIRLGAVGGLAALLALMTAYTIYRSEPSTKYDVNLINPPTQPAPSNQSP